MHQANFLKKVKAVFLFTNNYCKQKLKDISSNMRTTCSKYLFIPQNIMITNFFMTDNKYCFGNHRSNYVVLDEKHLTRFVRKIY